MHIKSADTNHDHKRTPDDHDCFHQLQIETIIIRHVTEFLIRI